MTTGSGRRWVGPTLCVLLVAACGDDGAAGQEWGPLAVAESAGGDEALVSGAIEITDRCVLLLEDDEPVLLVWPRERTRWDSGERSVEFETGAGDRVTFRDGDQATFTGGGASATENADVFTKSVDWVSEPAPECVVDTRWFVSDAR